ncbi:conserved hypothetical protein [Gloeothece citriformis PCC 7424]|uniref:Uncharacterized protein n=1 Tax=Gloeothece citriformis (strain PCC 7424) TaxID=65393 RepID=B7KAF4_GLOC7|nr:hypothetical protein [Gloeothece citriformis]ACK72928.1 conserved hypothetical protein [Gloeothece citriformis PCC 7424]
MSIVLSLFRSLFLSFLLCFALPIILVGTILVSLYIVNYIPCFASMSQTTTTQIYKFLSIFGDGCPVQGMLTISCTWAFVGSLFDLFNFSMYQGWRNQSSQLSDS